MASMRVPLFLYAECILDAARPEDPAPRCESTRRLINDYIQAQNRQESYYVLPLDDVLDVEAPSPKDTAQLQWHSLKTMSVDDTFESHGQTYHPTAWIRRNKKWVPFEFVNLGLWETMSINTDDLRTVAKGLLFGVSAFIEDTPLENTLVVRRVEVAMFPDSELGALQLPEEAWQTYRRRRSHACIVI